MYSATTPPATHCEAGWKASVEFLTPAEVSLLPPMPAVDAGSFSVLLIAGMLSMFACSECVGAHATTICDVIQ